LASFFIQKSQKSNYEKINENQFEFEKIINEIVAKVEKLGYGQQIIFEEIKELKDIYLHINKKNLGQI
jgi:hypothetical protein